MLCRFYAEAWEEPFADALALAETVECTEANVFWQDWDRRSQVKGEMTLGGLLGYMSFVGELTPFMRYLHIGQYLHLGKVTSMGLGAYRCL